MQHKNRFKIFIVTVVLLTAIVSVWLVAASPASAQCGSQASSCKNCHEVQGEDPVNTDGTSWHQSHAFGDFCYICHAGNNQATDKDEAHTGMVDPLSDVKASCMQCHPSDLDERAQVYAAALGVDLSTVATEGEESQPTESATVVSSGIGLMAPTELEINDPNTVDYVQRYNTLVLGDKPLNIGNLVLGGLIGMLLLGGGAFVIYNEGWVGVDYEKVDEYPGELVALLPNISHLTPPARRKLDQILADPHQADRILSKIEVPKE